MSKTHWKKLTNPDYLGSYSLDLGQEIVLTIKEVKKEVVTGPEGKKEECIVCHFVEQVKPMILNSTNSKTIEKMYETPYIEDWGGKKIQVYSAKVKAFGSVMDALRIRPKIPTTKKQTLNIAHQSWDAACKAIQNGETTIDAIKKKYNLTADSEELLLSLCGGGKNAS